ncbi:MAG TPA: DUF47 family protein [Coxiellaceae bacterium]|nr:DUF47 family protein [Coxiellaceae bacterium]
MLKSFLPRQEEFFDLFEAIVDCATKAAEALYQEIQALPFSPKFADQVAQYKRMVSTHAQRLFTLLHKTFITPFDRYDIHRLNDKLYDVANTVNLTARRFPSYDIQKVPPQMIVLAEISYQSIQLVAEIIRCLRKLPRHPEVVNVCNKIKSFESQADQLLIDGITSLLKEETDFKTILKLKEVYELMESITDRCQEVAFIIEGIVLENA